MEFFINFSTISCRFGLIGWGRGKGRELKHLLTFLKMSTIITIWHNIVYHSIPNLVAFQKDLFALLRGCSKTTWTTEGRGVGEMSTLLNKSY